MQFSFLAVQQDQFFHNQEGRIFCDSLLIYKLWCLSIRVRKIYCLMAWHQKLLCSVEPTDLRAIIAHRWNDCLGLAASEPWIPSVTGCAGEQTSAYWYKLNLKIAIYSPNQTNHCNAVFSFSSYFQATTFNHFETCFMVTFFFPARV